MLTVVARLFDARMWLAVVAAVVGYAVVFWAGVRRSEEPTRQALRSQLQASSLFADGLANIEAVKAAAAEARLGERYRSLAVDGEQRWRRCHVHRFETSFAATLIFVTTLAWVMFFGVSGLAAGTISIGAFVLLNAYALQILQPLELAGLAIRDLAQGLNCLAAWSAIHRIPTEGREVAGLAEAERGFAASGLRAPAIRFKNIGFGYQPNRPILSGVDFEIPSGGLAAVVGPSGAGKSTLIRLVLRHYSPLSGQILFDGVPVDHINIKRLRRSIALVTQDVILFNDTLLQNLVFARPEASEAAIGAAINAAHLDELIARLPKGLQTAVGERGLKLSGGEKQRVSIARALLQDAPVLILDEATSALDAESERMICADLVRSRQGRTTLLITHRLALAAQADAILVLSDGRVIERGSHAALLAAGGGYAQLWRRQGWDKATHRDFPGLSKLAADVETVGGFRG